MGKTSKETLQKRAKINRIKKTGVIVIICLLVCNTALLDFFYERKKDKIEILTKENEELNATNNELRAALNESIEKQREIMKNIETMVDDTKNFIENIVEKE